MTEEEVFFSSVCQHISAVDSLFCLPQAPFARCQSVFLTFGKLFVFLRSGRKSACAWNTKLFFRTLLLRTLYLQFLQNCIIDGNAPKATTTICQTTTFLCYFCHQIISHDRDERALQRDVSIHRHLWQTNVKFIIQLRKIKSDIKR